MQIATISWIHSVIGKNYATILRTAAETDVRGNKAAEFFSASVRRANGRAEQVYNAADGIAFGTVEQAVEAVLAQFPEVAQNIARAE